MSRFQGSGLWPQLRAWKRFGQHFLEKAWVDKLIALLEAVSDDTFFEIGPGRAGLHEYVALGVEVHLAGHQLTPRLVPDSDEQSLGGPA